MGAKGMKGVHQIRAYLGDVFTHMYVGERGRRKVCTCTSVRQTVCAREGVICHCVQVNEERGCEVESVTLEM